MVDNTDQASGWFANVTGTTCATSIFEALDKKNITWKNYYETDIVDAFMYEYVQENAMDKLQHADQFYKDLENGELPQFSYINPEWCVILGRTCSPLYLLDFLPTTSCHGTQMKGFVVRELRQRGWAWESLETKQERFRSQWLSL